MAESILEWMKKNEKRFNSRPVSQRNRKLKQISTLRAEESNPQVTIDSFFSKKSQKSLFDESFSKEDFMLLTKRWKEQNLENIAAN
ncbi:MAG: hypothetical protein ACTSWX_08605 [Promethearchaeota archaeon]